MSTFGAKTSHGQTNSQDSPWPGLGGSHHLPLYNILYASPRSPHPNGILSRDSQVRILKLPKLGLLRLWGPITSRADLRLKWGLNQNFSFLQELFNDMLHATCTQRYWVDSRLLVVASQTTNLTPGLSFGHNLYFKSPNGSCELILNI